MITRTSDVQSKSTDSLHLPSVQKTLVKKSCESECLLECMSRTRILCLMVTAIGRPSRGSGHRRPAIVGAERLWIVTASCRSPCIQAIQRDDCARAASVDHLLDGNRYPDLNNVFLTERMHNLGPRM